jgi:hypothetical protein
MHHIRSQWNKTRPQQPKKKQKLFKHMEIEQHTAERVTKSKGRNLES